MSRQRDGAHRSSGWSRSAAGAGEVSWWAQWRALVAEAVPGALHTPPVRVTICVPMSFRIISWEASGPCIAASTQTTRPIERGDGLAIKPLTYFARLRGATAQELGIQSTCYLDKRADLSAAGYALRRLHGDL